MKVALVVSGYPTPEEPARGVFNARAARALARRCSVRVIHVRGVRPGRAGIVREADGAAEVIRVAVPQAPLPSWIGHACNVVGADVGWRRVRRFLSDVDLVHSVGVVPLGAVVGLWARRLDIAHVSQVITQFDVQTSRFERIPFLGRWYERVDGVVCNSEALAVELRARHPAVPNVQRVYRGVDLEVFSPEGVRNDAFTSGARVRFAFFGGFPDYHLPRGRDTKGGLTLLRAWRAAEERLVDADAVLLVAGPACDAAEVRLELARLRAPERVRVVGSVDPRDIPAYIRASDVVAIPSVVEGLANIAMETSGCGRAMIASEIPGMSEIVVDGVTGWRLPAGDVDAWARGLVDAARRPAIVRERGAHARTHAVAQFDAATYGERLEALYRVVRRAT